MPAAPISTLIGGGEIASRVQILLDDHVAPPVRPRRWWSWIAAAVALAVFAAAYSSLLLATHELTELLVSTLP